MIYMNYHFTVANIGSIDFRLRLIVYTKTDTAGVCLWIGREGQLSLTLLDVRFLSTATPCIGG